MPSPFPGMDPYLEAPDRWANFHNGLASQIQIQLNRNLSDNYFAVVESREEVILGYFDDDDTVRFSPDVSIERFGETDESALQSGGAATAVDSDLIGSPHVTSVPVRLASVKIYHRSNQAEVVCVIEILSPANKAHGQERRRYEKKRDGLLESQAGFVEIDLLRAGESFQAGYTTKLKPYLILSSLVHEDLKREDWAYPVGLAEPLPVVAVPLGVGKPHALLDLQDAFTEAYDAGGYTRGLVDYTKPPRPPLSEPLQTIAATYLADRNAVG